MKIRIGVIGVFDTVEKIKKIMKEFSNQAEAYYFVYSKKEEIIDIVKNNQNNVDVLLFSGSFPYLYAQNNNAIKMPAVYVPRIASSIYDVLWKIRDRKLDYTSVSIDVIEEKDVYEVLDTLNIPKENFYVRSNSEMKNVDELFPFHYNLWKTGKTSVAITSNCKVKKRLVEAGTPVARLYPTNSSIREYINKAIYIADVERIKSTQTAIQIVRIKDDNIRNASEYEFLKLKNHFEAILIDYTQQNFGSFFPFGNNEYLIFTTRGALNKKSIGKKFSKIIELEKELNIVFASGIGYGSTVYKAEINARIALSHAMKKTASSCFIVDEDGEISGPISSCDEIDISYKLFVTEDRIQNIANEINISPTYVAKIKSIIEQTGKDVMDSEEISNYLSISLRSARRIINQFLDGGYAKVIGKGRQSPTGRPRRIIKIEI
ncbi:hypothetical protein [Maledivibacter halophilus]|uniref:Transcriptional regulator n=1 Tax=Maledivibacter halophilus TaxID=36842 RepID=A0A1T5MPP3_9FIRM|nr:hypothetical protein [Maledivibacter halophilus]SKC90195.1 hypothetical protein SAMN02194393_05133 [Maledivibacter halophilus]